MGRNRAGRAARHRVLEHPQASLCLGPPTAPSPPTSSRYRSNTKCHIDLADAPLSDRIAAYPAHLSRPVLAAMARTSRAMTERRDRCVSTKLRLAIGLK